MRHSVQIIGDNLGLTSLITGRQKQVKTKDSGGLKSTYNFFLHILCVQQHFQTTFNHKM